MVHLVLTLLYPELQGLGRAISSCGLAWGRFGLLLVFQELPVLMGKYLKP